MPPLIASSPDFASYGLLAVLLVAVGFVVGAMLCRRGWMGRGTIVGTDPTQQAMHGLFEWTHDVVGDIDECRNKMAAICDALGSPADEESAGKLSVAEIVNKVLEANDQMQQRLSSAESSLDRQAQQINDYLNQAHTDALTGLPNRRAFDEEISARNTRWRRNDDGYALLMIDVDFFKKFNDTFGHQAGDRVLKGVARRMEHAVRENDMVARYGGEEFGVILHAGDPIEAHAAAQRIRLAIEAATITFEGQTFCVTASCGLATALPHEDVESVIKRADKALYAAKEAGRNCCHWHDGRKCVAIAALEDITAEVPTIETANPGDEETEPLEELPAACNRLRERLLEVLAVH